MRIICLALSTVVRTARMNIYEEIMRIVMGCLIYTLVSLYRITQLQILTATNDYKMTFHLAAPEIFSGPYTGPLSPNTGRAMDVHIIEASAGNSHHHTASVPAASGHHLKYLPQSGQFSQLCSTAPQAKSSPPFITIWPRRDLYHT